MNRLSHTHIQRTEQGCIDFQHYEKVARELRADKVTDDYIGMKTRLEAFCRNLKARFGLMARAFSSKKCEL